MSDAVAELSLDTKPLLRPHQLADAQEDRANLEAKLRSPYITEKGEVARQIKRLDASLAAQTPKEFTGKDKDKAVALEAELRGKILDGMLSQEEMRKNPPGAVDRHIAWEKRNKVNVELWKNLQLRLNAGSTDQDIANFEKYRPTKSNMNMDGAQITGKQFYFPPMGVAPTVTFSKDELAFLKDVSPELAEKLALLSNEDRAQIKKGLGSKE